MAGQRKNLFDLFETGRPLHLENGNGDFEDLWLAKLEDVDHSAAVRKANAAKAEKMKAAKDSSCEEYQAMLADVSELDRDVLVDILTEAEMAPRRKILEAECAGEEGSEWAKDGYLEGLRTVWNDELKVVWAADDQDPRANHVLNEIKRFVAEVDVRIDEETLVAKAQFETLPNDDLLDRTVHMLISAQADAAWLDRYNDCVVWLSVRDPVNHQKHYFESLEQSKKLPTAVRSQILVAYNAMTIDLLPGGSEGKDLPAQPDSSPPSDSPATAGA